MGYDLNMITKHPMDACHLPFWRRPDQVIEPGSYALTRTDDDLVPRRIVMIGDDLRVYEDDGSTDPYGGTVKDWDEQCRFFGPIPRCDD
jgi:hypothetical protein